MVSSNATDSALGFRYQERYALLQLLESAEDEASISVELLDDIHFTSDGGDLFEQLKNTVYPNPPPLTITSRNVWSTLRIWCEMLPSLDVDSARFHLISVANIAESSPLKSLTSDSTDREAVWQALYDEAIRVVEKYDAAKSAGSSLPFQDRIKSAQSFLAITKEASRSLIDRIVLIPNSINVSENFAPNGPNYTHFSDSIIDMLYLSSFSINEKDKRTNKYRIIDSLIMEEAPVAVLYYDKVVRFVQKDITGMTINPINMLNLERVKKQSGN